MRKTVLDPLLPRVTQELLVATCLAPARGWYLSELARHLGRAPSTLQQPLAQLVAAGILHRRKDGNRVYYEADRDCPFLPDLRGLLQKTVGYEDVLREALSPFAERIAVSFVYGSLARGDERSTSDVDLLIIGDVGLRELSPVWERVEAVLRRAVNAQVYSAAEFARRVRNKNHFLCAVLDARKQFVIGERDDLEALAGRGPRRRSSDEPAGTGRSAGRRRAQSARRRGASPVT